MSKLPLPCCSTAESSWGLTPYSTLSDLSVLSVTPEQCPPQETEQNNTNCSIHTLRADGSRTITATRDTEKGSIFAKTVRVS